MKLFADDTFRGHFDRGLLVYFGVGGKLANAEEEHQIDAKELKKTLQICSDKILRLRTFPKADSDSAIELSLQDLCHENSTCKSSIGIALVSQFTLFADFSKGNRPSFSAALPRKLACQVYNEASTVFLQTFQERLVTGIFGSDMKIHYVNDGPITYMFDAYAGKIVNL